MLPSDAQPGSRADLREKPRRPLTSTLDGNMRECFFDPTASHPALREAEVLARKIYQLHEAGAKYSTELQRLGRLAGRIISLGHVLGAFGSIDPETFARKCLIDWDALPADATEAEMLEMLQLICEAKGSEFQGEYWVQCLRLNTGDDRISDLIYWPDDYFGRPIETDLSAAEILEFALGRRGHEHAV